MMERHMVLLVTLYRRYHELARNLTRLHERAKLELGYQPDVILVWAQPEITRLWFIQELLASGQVKYVIGRPALPGEENGATTYPESHNLRMGLAYIRDHYDAETHYAVAQAADVWVQDGTLRFVADHIKNGQQGVIFHWDNGCIHYDIWHTNFFAVPLDERYWPPLSHPGHQDVLERQWGLHLKAACLPGLFPWHNNNGRRFLHEHLSEQLSELEHCSVPQRHHVPLFITGHLPWYARLWLIAVGWVRGV